MSRRKLKGNLILLLAAIIWGTSFIAQSKGVEEISPMTFIGVRSLLGSVSLLPIIFFLDSRKKRSGADYQKADKTLWVGGTICGLLLFAATVLQTVGLVYTSPGKGGFITALYMIIIPIFGLFTGKRPRPVILISVLVATVGMYLMCINEAFSINIGDVWIFICAFFFAGHILVIDHISPKVDGVKLSCIQFFVCGVISMLGALVVDKPAIGPILDVWVSITYSGVMSCGVAYTLQIVGQKYTDPTSASILMSLESVFATLSTVALVSLGFPLTGGAMSPREIFGCILMFVAITLVQLPSKEERNALAQ